MEGENMAIITDLIQVTEKALQQIAQIWEKDRPAEGNFLRIAVVGGGCSGLSYKIEFSPQKDRDNIIPIDDQKKIIIDPKSSLYLKGIVLDFQDGLNGKGFVFQNPNAKNTCGCGESFSI